MIATIPQLKKDMEFNTGLLALIEVMKNVAVSQYQVLERRLTSGKELFDLLGSFFDLINLKPLRHPFLTPMSKTVCVVAVTSDAGLLGGLNSQVLSTALEEVGDQPAKIVIVGERGQMYLRDRRVAFTGFEGIQDDAKQGQAVRLVDYLAAELLRKKIGYLKVIYPRPLSFTQQRIDCLQVVPFVREEKDAKEGPKPESFIWESHPARLAEYLIRLWMARKFYDIFGLSRLSELAARYIHLEESARKLEKEQGTLKLKYFRMKHELIDRNMRDLFAARALYG
ncbi:MAG: F0F1 ATP synthase subunit gamma [Candidatus Omnitrophica bacterium]|nr:F0F1 ATP synthase subunit gamma [Candidatus Omnitrophota bacterium]